MKVIPEFLDKSLMLQARNLYKEVSYEQRQKRDKVRNIKCFLKDFYFKENLMDPKALEYRDLMRDLFKIFIVFSFLISNKYF